jgi:hypothetical protein
LAALSIVNEAKTEPNASLQRQWLEEKVCQAVERVALTPMCTLNICTAFAGFAGFLVGCVLTSLVYAGDKISRHNGR